MVAASLARADEGMWLVNHPPLERWKSKYQFEPSPDWLEHLQKSAVYMGASGSFVSSKGLLITNHHVGAGQLAKLSTPERDLLRDGFYARSRENELRCLDLEIKVLMSIEDVSGPVRLAAADMNPAAANEARRKKMAEIEQEWGKKTGLDCEMVMLWGGAQYHLYCYKRYTDIRLVFAPESSIAFFGGDTDNFEYPRYDLDVCFFRIYENDQPIEPERFLRWSQTGLAENELCFVLGHPGRTRRLFTVDHLKHLRDVEQPWDLRMLWRREVQLQTFSARNAENERIARDNVFGVQNSRKAQTGGYQALLNPAAFEAKRAREQTLRAANGSPAWDNLAAALSAFREYFPSYRLLEGGSIAHGSDYFWTARGIVRLVEEQTKPSGERLREYRDSEMDSVLLDVYSPAPIYPELEKNRLACGLQLACEIWGADDPRTQKLLAGKSPADRAVELCDTKIGDVNFRKRLVEGGQAEVDASDDPMIRFIKSIDADARALRKRYEDEVQSIERETYAEIAKAVFEVEGDSSYPDATNTLRISYGTVTGYDEYGKRVRPFTDFAGLYQRHEERRGQAGFDIPDLWIQRRDQLRPGAPYNFVCTADIIGGNSGSPVVNKKGEFVGIIFDGNIHSLSGDFYYDDRLNRAVAVDSRGIVDALRKIYTAEALVQELGN
jgi:hypothetical protein